MRLRIARIESQGLPVRLHRLLQPAPCRERVAEIIMRLRQIGLRLQRPAIETDRVVQFFPRPASNRPRLLQASMCPGVAARISRYSASASVKRPA